MASRHLLVTEGSAHGTAGVGVVIDNVTGVEAAATRRKSDAHGRRLE